MEDTESEFIRQLQPNRYDNDVTLLYKFVGISGLPTNLIISRSRKPGESGFGSNNLLFESLTDVIARLVKSNHTPADMYDIINNYKNTISLNDIIMTWYGLYQDINIDTNYIIVNDLYRQMDETSTIDQFEDEQQLNSSYNAWLSNIDELVQYDRVRLDKILNIHHQLEEVGDVSDMPYSPVNISSTTTAYRPKLLGKSVTVDDGLDIFNYSIPSVYAPFIKYVDKFGKAYYKVYNGGKLESEPNYDLTIIKKEKSNRPNTIYITLWLGDYNSDGSVQIKNAIKESFFTVLYNLDNNYLTVEAPIGVSGKKGLVREKEVAIARAQNAMPNIVFGSGQETRVKGNFKLWNINLDESLFLHMILNFPVLSVYLYDEETVTPHAFKQRLDIHFRSIYSDIKEAETRSEESNIANYASVSITINNKITTVEDNYQIMTDDGPRLQKVAAQTPYLSIKVSKATSKETLEEFVKLFQILIGYYRQNVETVQELYDTIIPGVRDELQVLLSGKNKKIEKQGGKGKSKGNKYGKGSTNRIDDLKAKAPDLFVEPFSRLCQAKHQPIIIDPADIEEFTNQRFGPKNMKRQVMPFPKDNPIWYFGCPDDAIPYPGVKLNNRMPNKDKYPYFPCCAETDSMAPGSNSKYRKYIENVPIDRKRGAKAEKKISTNKILRSERVAFLPKNINELVNAYTDNPIDMVRFGVPNSINSLLHCVCVAVDDPQYYAIEDDEELELYINGLRQYIADHVDPALLKQEMFDYDDDEIISYLTKTNEYYDPSLVYRAVEEIFGVNIYVFTTLDNGDGVIDIPRFKVFHSRPERLYRPTIVIIKTMGSESNGLEFPQCELIVDFDRQKNEIVKLFGASMTKICHNVLIGVMKTLSWEPEPARDRTFSVHANLFYYIDHPDIFRTPIVSQYIDDYGKMRAITLDLGSSGFATIQTIPSQPENIPHSQEIHRMTFELATRMLGNPIACTRDIYNRIDGLWYQIMDVKFGEYVPIVPINATGVLDDLEVGRLNPLVPEGENLTGRMSVLKRTLNIIIQIVRWLYELALSDGVPDPLTFAQRYMAIDEEPVEDSAVYYDLSALDRKLPSYNTIDEALADMETIIPDLISNGMIIMYNKTFADRMIRMLTDYDNLRQGMDHTRKNYIDNFFERDTDFIQNPGSKIFISNKDLDAWLLSLKSTQDYSKYFKINKTLTVNMKSIMDPIIYEHNDGTMYIIQNVIGGSYAKALAVAQTWKNYKINVGSNATPVQVTPPHVIYSISPTSIIKPIQDHRNGNTDFLKILYFGPSNSVHLQNGHFAAILRIL